MKYLVALFLCAFSWLAFGQTDVSGQRAAS